MYANQACSCLFYNQLVDSENVLKNIIIIISLGTFHFYFYFFVARNKVRDM